MYFPVLQFPFSSLYIYFLLLCWDFLFFIHFNHIFFYLIQHSYNSCLMFLPNNSNIWVVSGLSSVDFHFPWERATVYCFLFVSFLCMNWFGVLSWILPILIIDTLDSVNRAIKCWYFLFQQAWLLWNYKLCLAPPALYMCSAGVRVSQSLNTEFEVPSLSVFLLL